MQQIVQLEARIKKMELAQEEALAAKIERSRKKKEEREKEEQDQKAWEQLERIASVTSPFS
jgi:hypothetical protein